jgi:hypothetical protein
VISQQTRSKTLPYFIADKTLIVEVVKELLYQERMKDSVRLLGISLNNLNTEQKKKKICYNYVHVQQGLKFTNYYLFVVINFKFGF